jgi:predicted esterase YcpF (UPF0227 family)
MKILIYLHGLNSSGLSQKAGILRQKLAPIPVLAPSYPAHRPDDAVAVLSDFFDKLTGSERPLVVGSSMGGFYGQYLARRYPMAHLFMINPALRPWDLLTEFRGQHMTTADGVDYPIDDALIERTRKYRIDNPCDGIVTTLFLDQGDEVIDYRIAESIYANCGRVIVFERGDHAFQHLDEAIEVIREFF